MAGVNDPALSRVLQDTFAALRSGRHFSRVAARFERDDDDVEVTERPGPDRPTIDVEIQPTGPISGEPAGGNPPQTLNDLFALAAVEQDVGVSAVNDLPPVEGAGDRGVAGLVVLLGLPFALEILG